MAYFKAFTSDLYNGRDYPARETGFYSHSIIGIFKDGAKKTTVTLDTGLASVGRTVNLNLPIEDVHKIFSYLEVYPGVADLLDASNPENKEKVKYVEVNTAQRGKHKITLG